MCQCLCARLWSAWGQHVCFCGVFLVVMRAITRFRYRSLVFEFKDKSRDQVRERLSLHKSGCAGFVYVHMCECIRTGRLYVHVDVSCTVFSSAYVFIITHTYLLARPPRHQHLQKVRILFRKQPSPILIGSLYIAGQH